LDALQKDGTEVLGGGLRPGADFLKREEGAGFDFCGGEGKWTLMAGAKDFDEFMAIGFAGAVPTDGSESCHLNADFLAKFSMRRLQVGLSGVHMARR